MKVKRKFQVQVNVLTLVFFEGGSMPESAQVYISGSYTITYEVICSELVVWSPGGISDSRCSDNTPSNVSQKCTRLILIRTIGLNHPSSSIYSINCCRGILLQLHHITLLIQLRTCWLSNPSGYFTCHHIRSWSLATTLMFWFLPVCTPL